MLETLMKSPIAWAVLSIITIVSLPLAIYSLVTSKKKKEFSYIGRSYCIVEKGKKKLENLQLTYMGKTIDDITITQYAIWNSGNQLLERKDIVADQPLRLIAKNEVQLLEAHIATETEESNKFVISNSGNSVRIDFDYVEVNDGIVLQVIHTGHRRDLSLECKIKGGKPVKCKNSQSKKQSSKQMKKTQKIKLMLIPVGIMICSMLVVGIVMLLTGVGIISENRLIRFIFYPQVEVSTRDQLMFGSALMVFCLGYSFVIGYLLKNILGIGVPQKLRTYSSNDYFD